MTLLQPGPLTAARRDRLRRRVRLIVLVAIAYNVVEALVAIVAGAAASSAALVGFGLDSVVEVVSAATIAWQFSSPDHEAREHRALRIVASSFFALAAWVTYDAVQALLTGRDAEPSTVGIALAALSLAVMPGLALLERRAGTELRSASVVADSRQLLLCSYLSAVLLVGLLLNAMLGWSWADPAAALVIAAVAVREGVQALRGDTCCSPLPTLGADTESDAGAAAEASSGDDCCATGACASR